ncbi:MAG: hypothetical protein MUD01_11270 [Chloroflexaceae bacterium]|jgi:hypothetical protein|nr:hypothetical protein [Chloroflexaceae bacterium]
MNRSRRDKALETVAFLLNEIGPRPATSLAEAQAAAFVDGRLRRAGMSVSVDTFRAETSPGLNYALLALPGVVVALITPWWPVPALLLALLGLGLVVWDGVLAPLPLFASRRDSQNVIGICASEQTPRWRMVLLAPLDSAPQPEARRGLSGFHRRAILGRCCAFGLLALLALLALLLPSPLWWYSQALPAAYLLLSATLAPALEARASYFNPSAGSVGALAVLLTAAERLQGLQHVQLWAVALGATSTCGTALRDLLRRYPFDQEDTLWLSLESIGDGQLTYATREGVLRHFPSDPLLMQLVEVTDTADPVIDAEPRPYSDAPALAAQLHRSGRRVLSLRTLPKLAPAAATAATVPPTMDRAARLVVGLVRQLESTRNR